MENRTLNFQSRGLELMSVAGRYAQRGELLGHNDPKTTMIYTHVSSKKLSEINSLFDDFEL